MSRDAKGRFKRGTSGNPAGRPKGARDKLGGEIRDLVKEALARVGGADYLVEQARENPATFLGLCAKLIPHELALAAKFDGTPLIELRDFSRPGGAHEALSGTGLVPQLPARSEVIDVTPKSDTEPAELEPDPLREGAL